MGVAEGGLLPGMVLYLSMLYRREELAVRMGLVYSSASLSGAFGGLLATGINNGLEGVGGYKGFRWIFIVEGLMVSNDSNIFRNRILWLIWISLDRRRWNYRLLPSCQLS